MTHQQPIIQFHPHLKNRVATEFRGPGLESFYPAPGHIQYGTAGTLRAPEHTALHQISRHASWQTIMEGDCNMPYKSFMGKKSQGNLPYLKFGFFTVHCTFIGRIMKHSCPQKPIRLDFRHSPHEMAPAVGYVHTCVVVLTLLDEGHPK